MKHASFVVVLVAAALLGCEQSAQPPVEVSDVELFGALPGSAASVGYMTLTNNTDSVIGITGVSSSAFGKVEMHETTLTNGVARMRRVTTLTVKPHDSVLLSRGGLHLMLMEPSPDATIGQSITLTLRYDGGGEVLVHAPLRSRNTTDERH
ncbi:MAG: copper chaperone PCu(A)C [Pseudomonadota bacterium]